MSGIVNLYKPTGMSSNTAVGRVKRALSVKKCGHTGTLDPLAEGVLPILLDSATGFSDFLMEGEKQYVATIHLGHTTTTLDSEGEDITLLPRDEVKVTKKQLDSVLESFLGESEQIPPMFSALSQNGVKLYKLARKGIEVERKPRKIFISAISCEKFDDREYYADIRVTCGKGTYIRTLAQDIGQKLGVGAMMSHLVRTATGIFTADDAVRLENLTENDIIPVEHYFTDLPIVKPIPFFLRLLRDGQKVLQKKLKTDIEVGKYARLYDENDGFVGLLLATDNQDGEKLLHLVKRV